MTKAWLWKHKNHNQHLLVSTDTSPYQGWTVLLNSCLRMSSFSCTSCWDVIQGSSLLLKHYCIRRRWRTDSKELPKLTPWAHKSPTSVCRKLGGTGCWFTNTLFRWFTGCWWYWFTNTLADAATWLSFVKLHFLATYVLLSLKFAQLFL